MAPNLDRALGVIAVIGLTACTRAEAPNPAAQTEPAPAPVQPAAPSAEPAEASARAEAGGGPGEAAPPSASETGAGETGESGGGDSGGSETGGASGELTAGELARAAAGRGFEPGPRPKLSPHENASSDSVSVSRSHAGVTVTASAHAEPKDEEYEYVTALQVRVEFEALPGPELGLNYVGGGGDDYCDELLPEIQELAQLDDGRWLVDAQLACRSGEDYFEASNDHALILIDPARPRAELLWTGTDAGSSAMGVCVSSRVTSFEVEADAVIIRETSVTDLDAEAAEELPEAAEGCKPAPATTKDLARVELSMGREL